MNRTEVSVLEPYMIRSTVPIITTQTKDGRGALLGTSTLFDVRGRLFLVTAAHLFTQRGLDMTRLAVPASPYTYQLWALGSLERISTPDDIDIAALEIKSPEMESVLRAGWQTVTFNQVALATAGGRFVLSGFPESLTDPTAELLKAKFVSIYTDRLPSTPHNAEPPVHSNVDLFFLCDDSAESLDGKKLDVPRLPGTSGASIWQVVEPPGGQLWSPQSALRVVAIQSAVRHLEYFRGKSWRFAAQMFCQLDDAEISAEGKALAERLDRNI